MSKPCGGKNKNIETVEGQTNLVRKKIEKDKVAEERYAPLCRGPEVPCRMQEGAPTPHQTPREPVKDRCTVHAVAAKGEGRRKCPVEKKHSGPL